MDPERRTLEYATPGDGRDFEVTRHRIDRALFWIGIAVVISFTLLALLDLWGR